MISPQKRVILIVAILILIIGLIFFYLFYVKKCSSSECFNSAMEKCKKASYTKNEDKAVWGYEVLGKIGGIYCKFTGRSCDACEVRVTLIQVNKGTRDLESLNGLSMNCLVPLSFVGNPEADLKSCSGPLKEGIQDTIIKKMHAYILENLGKVSEELTKI